MKNYMGIDQHGTTYHNLGRSPRKALLDRLGKSKASPMFIDKPGGRSVRIGYVIGRLWITLYEVKPMEVPFR